MEEGFRGLYRTTAWAYVSNGLMSFQVIKMDYQRFGYQPDYDQLPWKEDYLATGTPGGKPNRVSLPDLATSNSVTP